MTPPSKVPTCGACNLSTWAALTGFPGGFITLQLAGRVNGRAGKVLSRAWLWSSSGKMIPATFQIWPTGMGVSRNAMAASGAGEVDTAGTSQHYVTEVAQQMGARQVEPTPEQGPLPANPFSAHVNPSPINGNWGPRIRR